jgi:hypothetical protein
MKEDESMTILLMQADFKATKENLMDSAVVRIWNKAKVTLYAYCRK